MFQSKRDLDILSINVKELSDYLSLFSNYVIVFNINILYLKIPFHLCT